VSARPIPKVEVPSRPDLSKFVPEELRRLGDLQSAIPEVAKNQTYLTLIERAVKEIPTRHVLVHGDARRMSKEKVGKAHLIILTSPPYWTLKKYRDSSGRLGLITDYDDFVEDYLDLASRRLEGELSSLFSNPVLVMEQE